MFAHDLFGKPVPTFPDHALAPEGLPQRGLGLIELGALLGRELGSGAVDVEVDHRHGGAIGVVAVARRVFGGFLQGRCDLLGSAAGEQAGSRSKG